MNFQNQVEYLPEMLDNLPIPPEINPQTLQSAIMLECGLLTPLYSEPQTMRAAILQWFTERQWTFEHLVNIIKAKYSPIENTDRYEDLSESNITDITHSETMDRDYLREEERSSGEDKSRAEEVNGQTDNDKHVSAYNTGDYAPTDSGSATSSTSMDTSESNEYSESASFTESETNTADRKIDDDRTHQLLRHVHGNIGVTTNQELIQQELALLQGFNIYNWIALNLRHSLFLEVW